MTFVNKNQITPAKKLRRHTLALSLFAAPLVVVLIAEFGNLNHAHRRFAAQQVVAFAMAKAGDSRLAHLINVLPRQRIIRRYEQDIIRRKQAILQPQELLILHMQQQRLAAACRDPKRQLIQRRIIRQLLQLRRLGGDRIQLSAQRIFIIGEPPQEQRGSKTGKVLKILQRQFGLAAIINLVPILLYLAVQLVQQNFGRAANVMIFAVVAQRLQHRMAVAIPHLARVLKRLQHLRVAVEPQRVGEPLDQRQPLLQRRRHFDAANIRCANSGMSDSAPGIHESLLT